jgi:hypothetical protein
LDLALDSLFCSLIPRMTGRISPAVFGLFISRDVPLFWKSRLVASVNVSMEWWPAFCGPGMDEDTRLHE